MTNEFDVGDIIAYTFEGLKLAHYLVLGDDGIHYEVLRLSTGLYTKFEISNAHDLSVKVA